MDQKLFYNFGKKDKKKKEKDMIHKTMEQYLHVLYYLLREGVSYTVTSQ